MIVKPKTAKTMCCCMNTEFCKGNMCMAWTITHTHAHEVEVGNRDINDAYGYCGMMPKDTND